jgi:glycerol-3-phosphate dehydrogenase (NAD(P)+)
MSRIAIVGAGAFGTALATHAARLDHEVDLWSHEPRVAEEIGRHHENRSYLPGIALPRSIRASGDLAAVVSGARFVLLAAPTQHCRSVAGALAAHLDRDAIVIVAAKGIELRSDLLLSDVLAQALPDHDPKRTVFLSGPSFAREVARGLPTDVAVASHEGAAAREVAEVLHAPLLRLYTSADPIGVQIGGAIKNVIAIAAGACDGLGLGANARAALVTRGLAEIARIGVAIGGDPLTFLGMAGAGDLFLTCSDDQSRNRTLGKKIAEGVDAPKWIASQSSVAEGYHTAAAAHGLARRLGVDAPITEQVYAVCHQGKPLLEAMRDLVTRESKSEVVGISERPPRRA